MSTDPRARLRELSDFAAPWAVWVAATLRLADHIEDGAVDLDALAERTGADRDALHRLLQYLVARRVFARDGDVYANTDLSELLLDARGWRQWLDLDGAPGVWADSWTRLLAAVRRGTPGRDEGWYYGELARTGRGRSFDGLMAVQIGAHADAVAALELWMSVETVVDVGGGTGLLLRTLLDAHPHLRASLFDLPQVVAAVEPGERLTVIPGNVLADPVPAADVHVLSQILHGWPDGGALRILERCAGGERILLLESVPAEPPSADDASFDLFMLTLVGGRQRTLADFERLAARCGRSVTNVHPLESGHAVIELR